jgi:hypothetical protein
MRVINLNVILCLKYVWAYSIIGTRNFSQDRRCLSRDLKRRCPQHKSRPLPLWQPATPKVQILVSRTQFVHLFIRLFYLRNTICSSYCGLVKNSTVQSGRLPPAIKFYPGKGASMFLQNICDLLPHYTVSSPTRPRTKHSPGGTIQFRIR